MHSPKLDDFLKLAAQGNLIPVTRRILADFETPLSAYKKIRGQGESFLFESVEGGEHLGRYSFVGCNPRAVIKQTANRLEVIADGKVVEKFAIPAPGKEPGEQCVRDGLEGVERVLARYRPVNVPASPAARSASSATNTSRASSRPCPPRKRTNSACPSSTSCSPIRC